MMLWEAENSLVEMAAGLIRPKPPKRGGRVNRLRIVLFGGEHPVRAGISTSRILSLKGCKSSEMLGIV